MWVRKQRDVTFSVNLSPLLVQSTLLAYLNAPNQPSIRWRSTRGRLEGVVSHVGFQFQRHQPPWLREWPPRYEGTFSPMASGTTLHIVARSPDDLLLVSGLFSAVVLLLGGFAQLTGTVAPWGLSVMVGFSLVLHAADLFFFVREVRDELAVIHEVLVHAMQMERARVDTERMRGHQTGV